jgi:hypothetical protein
MVDSGWFYSSRNTKQAREWSLEKMRRARESTEKAVDSVLKCESHSHHQDGDVPSASLAVAWQCNRIAIDQLLTCD